MAQERRTGQKRYFDMLNDLAPPQSIEAEQAVLGSILLRPTALFDVIEIIGKDSEPFYTEAHRTIFDAMLDVQVQNKALDEVSLVCDLENRGELDAVGGAAYLGRLMDVPTTSAHIDTYARAVMDAFRLRCMMTLCRRLHDSAATRPTDTAEFFDSAQAELWGLFDSRETEAAKSVAEVAPVVVGRIKDMLETGQHPGFSSGIEPLDDIMFGFRPGVTILAARPGVGKSALALNFADHVSRQGIPVLFCSLEMTAESLVERLFAIRAGVDWRKVNKMFNLPGELDKATYGAGLLKGQPLFVDATPRQTIWDIRAKARQQVSYHGPSLIVVDYMQLIRHSGNRLQRHLEVAEDSAEFMALAQELRSPILLVAQLSRLADGVKDGYQLKSFLRESGSLEQDPDVVLTMFDYTKQEADALNKERVKRGQLEVDFEHTVVLTVAKHRQGPTGQLLLYLNKPRQLFSVAGTTTEG